MTTRTTFILSVLVAVLLPVLAYAQTSMPGSAPSSGAGVSGGGYACTMQYAPVCGAREVQCIKAPCYPIYETFGNSCVLNGEGAIYIHDGECTSDETGPYKGGTTKAYQPPATCTSWNDGCNSCARGEDGAAVCTMKYCAEPGAGYCTAYASNTNPDAPVASDVPPPVDMGGSAASPANPSVVVSFPHERSWSVWSFFGGAWNTLLLWLGF